MNIRQTRLAHRLATLLLGPVLAVCAGCPGSLNDAVPDGAVPDGAVSDGSASDEDGGAAFSSIVEGEPNGAFSLANDAFFNASGVAQLQGTVSTATDLDVFALGAILAGDRIVIDTSTLGSDLDISIALFDGKGRLVTANDDAGQSLDAFIDLTARRDSDPYFLVAAASAFAVPGTLSGSYTIDIAIDRGGAVPGPVRQTLFLDFDGALVDIASIFPQPFELAPFDAADISPVYAGQTELLKQLIVETIEQNYARFDVDIATSDAGQPGANTEFSTIFLGGFDNDTFGIAQSVDLYNADFCDDAIIFTGSFTPDFFSQTPTVSELAIAIGNVTAHEAGHLLGLNHTDDDLDLMDAASPADAFLEDQEYMEAPLSADVMPIGSQDGVLLLSEIVGLRDGVALKEATLVLRQRGTMDLRRTLATFDAFQGGEKIGLHAGTIRQLKARGNGPSR